MILYVWEYVQSSNTFSKIALIDNAISVIWIKRFNFVGNFEVYLPASQKLLQMFSSGEKFLSKENDDTFLMSIEEIKLETDSENGDRITISGRSAECLIGRRLVYGQMNFSGTAENCIRYMINQNMIQIADVSPQAYRKMPFLSLGESQGFTETIEKQATWKNILTVITDICVAYGYGFRLDFTGSGFVFNLYKGTDRSINQSENTYVIFSPEFENLGNTTYSLNKSTYYNYVFVGGEGQGTARKTVGYWDRSQPETPTGMRLRELFVDARNTSSNDGEIGADEYFAILRNEAIESLASAKETQTFDGETIETNIYVYGQDYDLGDTVSVINEYGLTGTATVTEITEVEDETGHKIYPTLSEWSV